MVVGIVEHQLRIDVGGVHYLFAAENFEQTVVVETIGPSSWDKSSSLSLPKLPSSFCGIEKRGQARGARSMRFERCLSLETGTTTYKLFGFWT